MPSRMTPGSRTPAGLIRRVLDVDRSLLVNAGSLFGATVLTAGIGVVYWAVAARVFPAAAVGLAAAAISAMLLIGQVATLGLGTVLMGELSHHGSSERSLIDSALLLVGLVAAVLGAGFVGIAGFIAPELRALQTPAGLLLFAAGAAVTAAGLVLDQALLGLLRGGLQLLRNAIASVAKLLVLFAIAAGLIAAGNGLALFMTWVVGGALSLVVVLAVRRAPDGVPWRPIWRVMEGAPALAIRHHLLNLSILAPGLLLPLLVTTLLSAEANAYFYIAYLIASFGWAIPAALATAVYAAGARDVLSLTDRVRLAFGLSLATGIVLNVFMLFGAGFLLSIFGPEYAARAGTLLRLFSLGIFAVTINSLFVPIARIERRFLSGTLLMVLSMVIEFAFVVVGARLDGLDGAGWGWFIGFSLGILPLLPAVIRVGSRGSVKRIESDAFGSMPATPPAARPAPPATAAAPAVAPVAAVANAATGNIATANAAAANAGASLARPTNGRLTIALATDGPVLLRWQLACVSRFEVDDGPGLVAWLHLGLEPPGGKPMAAALLPIGPTETPSGLPSPAGAAPGSDRGSSSATRYDVILDLTTAGLPAAVAGAGLETWRFAYGPDGGNDPRRSALRELVRGAGVIRIALVASSDGRVLREGWLRTPASVAGAIDQVLMEPAAWPAIVAAESRVAPARPDRLADQGGSGAGDRSDDPRPAPDGLGIPALRLAVAVRRGFAIRRVLTQHDDWNIGIVDRPIEDALGSWDLESVRWLPTRPGRYAADPFGIQQNGTLHVFFEDFDQRGGRGVISHTSLDARGAVSDPVPVLDAGYHTSYPFLVEDSGAIWMIPEIADAGEVRLYEAVDFPLRWRLAATLLANIQVSDPTVIRQDGRWWLFGTSRGRGVDHALRIWHAPALTGPWVGHRNDPVKVDARSARPGGTPFLVDGILYRPAQDSSRRYGGRVAVNRIETLTPDRFIEQVVATVDPGSRYPDGLHTLSAVGRRTLIDGNAMHFIPDALGTLVRQRFARGRAAPPRAGAMQTPTTTPPAATRDRQ
jgi:O-antigen/teichoic acid export membrane protein